MQQSGLRSGVLEEVTALRSAYTTKRRAREIVQYSTKRWVDSDDDRRRADYEWRARELLITRRLVVTERILAVIDSRVINNRAARARITDRAFSANRPKFAYPLARLPPAETGAIIIPSIA